MTSHDLLADAKDALRLALLRLSGEHPAEVYDEKGYTIWLESVSQSIIRPVLDRIAFLEAERTKLQEALDWLRDAEDGTEALVRDLFDRAIAAEERAVAAEEALRQILTEPHRWCRWGHGPVDDRDKRQGDELCTCGKVQRDAVALDAISANE